MDMNYNYYFLTRRGVVTIKKTIVDVNTSINKNYVALTQEQIEYYNAHPDASVGEVMSCRLTEIPEPTLEEVKISKIIEIDSYDCSDDVNRFYYNDQPMWLDKATRVGLVNLCNSLEIMGEDTINVWYGDTAVELTIQQCRQLLASIELYAMQCYNVTARHKVNVMDLTSIQEVNDYDYTAGYPEKLNL